MPLRNSGKLSSDSGGDKWLTSTPVELENLEAGSRVNFATAAPQGSMRPCASQTSGCFRALLADMPSQHCMDIEDCTFGVADSFIRSRTRGVFLLQGEHTPQSLWEGLYQGAGEERPSVIQASDSTGTMFFVLFMEHWPKSWEIHQPFHMCLVELENHTIIPLVDLISEFLE